MKNTTYISLSRQAALERQMDMIANNMANANTPAFKSQETMFKEFLVPTRSSNSVLGTKLSFVEDVGQVRDTREGTLTQTGNPLDVALHGDGYFEVETDGGMRFTRDGHFRLDEGGMLVDSQGLAVMDNRDQPIIFAPNETKITIAADGTVSSEVGRVATLKVVRFENDQALRNVGNSLYETTQEPDTVARPQIAQGMIEESNVQPVTEMTHMMSVLRQYESMQQMLQTESDRISKAMQVLSNTQAAA